MKKKLTSPVCRGAVVLALAVPPMTSFAAMPAAPSTGIEQPAQQVTGVKKTGATTAEVTLANGQRLLLDFYGDNIVRLFRDPKGGTVRDPEAKPEAKILVAQPRKDIAGLTVGEQNGGFTLSTGRIAVQIDKQSGLMRVTDTQTGRTVVEETAPALFEKNKVTLTLKAGTDEYFYGGGVQNGRFSHRGQQIAIENTNSWTDGGVCSPAPFYWSTGGYGIMWHTFRKGIYDFGAEKAGQVKLSHDTDYLDLFVMVNDTPVKLLNDYYQLTGNPVLLPKFGFYEGHLNAYNRDYWKESTNDRGVLFEDGKRYVESQKDNGGIRESLNGELPGNYQFSARAVIDRYKAHDMPLGWLLPNDGYGAGYGQTGSVDGNIANLKSLGDYARQHGVEIGLWTQSDLHPKEGIEPLLQRDIVKEVGTAGVRVLKTDVAWVGAGYSFGLNGITDVAGIMTKEGHGARPFIITLDGWAGTQRYAGVWSGDQTGGEWEYIRFHIPTYIGAGLSGMPNITSDMDGIFGGRNLPVNVRDFEWKTFTPMQLNMDGWGANEKYPQALGEPATSINRWYLKLKSELMPYTYSIAHEAVDGKPMLRALFLDYPNPYTLGRATQYEFLYGPSFLVAPIYKETAADKEGNDIRNGIYLPEGQWIDYFNGQVYEGGRILNQFDAPLWKLPVFVKAGAIIPMTKPNNNVSEIDKGYRAYELYPGTTNTTFTEYDDDGTTVDYLNGEVAKTVITMIPNPKGKAKESGHILVTIDPTTGSFDGMVKEKVTELRLNATAEPKKVTVRVGGKKVKLREAKTAEEQATGTNVYYYDAAPELNRFATPGSEFAKVSVKKNPQLIVRLAATDVTQSAVVLEVKGHAFAPESQLLQTDGTLVAPTGATVPDAGRTAYTLTPTWDMQDAADYYEIQFGDMLYSTIKTPTLAFEGLQPETKYDFKIRAVNRGGHSDWTTFSATTTADPLQHAVKGIKASASVANQGGQGIHQLFDFDEKTTWHTAWNKPNATPFDVELNLGSVNQLDKLQYLGREDAGNGTLLKGTVAVSMDRKTWTEVGTFDWAKDATTKVLELPEHPTARYLRLHVTEAVGGFGSGRELYVFKVPGSPSYIPGDINSDGKIDSSDLTSYMNYTGLRTGDSDFDGYVSVGDVNKNGLIDAYDISNVTTLLNGGVNESRSGQVAGSLALKADKATYNAGDTVRITVSGKDLANVNALSFALPYDTKDYEYAGLDLVDMKNMTDLTKDRLHTNGTKALYPTFANQGNEFLLEGSGELFVIKFVAKRRVKFALTAKDGLLVDRRLGTVAF